jgi:hypothetical protein
VIVDVVNEVAANVGTHHLVEHNAGSRDVGVGVWVARRFRRVARVCRRWPLQPKPSAVVHLGVTNNVVASE